MYESVFSSTNDDYHIPATAFRYINGVWVLVKQLQFFWIIKTITKWFKVSDLVKINNNKNEIEIVKIDKSWYKNVKKPFYIQFDYALYKDPLH